MKENEVLKNKVLEFESKMKVIADLESTVAYENGEGDFGKGLSIFIQKLRTEN